MISEVRGVIRRLGVAGESAIRAETGLPASQINEALEFLLSHGYVRETQSAVDPAGCSIRTASDQAETKLPASSAVHCASCPMAAGCAPGLSGVGTAPTYIRVFQLT
ncbi:MAG: hypothetical protein LC641_03165 [Spirochaeta sp.]|nr:hypothetical protein [Spirochaeta sp.]